MYSARRTLCKARMEHRFVIFLSEKHSSNFFLAQLRSSPKVKWPCLISCFDCLFLDMHPNLIILDRHSPVGGCTPPWR